MLYSEPLFRPPAEADSLIVQITEGCAYNRCLFCPMYKGKDFRVHSPKEIAVHLRDLSSVFGPDQTRVFLADGDALVMDTDDFLAAMAQVRSAFPAVRRFAAYGSVFSLAAKTADDLLRLKAAGLRTVYLGLESGDEETLRRMGKYMAAPRMAGICRRVVEAGLNLSVMVVIGLGGRSRSRPHAEASARLVNEIRPSHTSLLNLLLAHTPLAADADYRDFALTDYFSEAAAFVAAVECRTIFRANHASNPVALQGVLPRDRELILSRIQTALSRCPGA
ncbi:MAG: radical SAM protein [Candidatus Aminicenantes bacterium]|nr:radical SAM protein [Candidatus Aminicenantes bacterium]